MSILWISLFGIADLSQGRSSISYRFTLYFSERTKLIVAASACVKIDEGDCFTNQTWSTSRLSVAASLWTQRTSVVYRRNDGTILQSNPTTIPTPVAISTNDLLEIYNATYGVADLFSSTIRTNDVLDTIRYHAVEQVTAWIQGNVGIRGAGGDDDHYWDALAVRSLIIVPMMDFTNAKTADNIATASSAKQFYRLIIPSISVCGFLFLVLIITVWSASVLTLTARFIVPNNTMFPEIDFGSKCGYGNVSNSGQNKGVANSVGESLHSLSNCTSRVAIRELSGITIYAGCTTPSPHDLPHITLTTTREGLEKLDFNTNYG
jgi:hypothetical protein